jgi:hypothetical protein
VGSLLPAPLLRERSPGPSDCVYDLTFAYMVLGDIEQAKEHLTGAGDG